jgi:prepilin-type N-terminal cleavage/methylation domain-containing protein
MRRQSGPTLIELLIVIVILSLAWPTLMPTVFGSQVAANATADSANLKWHGQQLELYKLQNKRSLPIAGGHKFVLSTWSIVSKTEENFDRYFIPGRRDNDPDYRKLRVRLERGERIWEDLESTTSLDTHYAGRAKDHLASATNGKDEALMADDNEGVWSHANGSVNVLFCGGDVRTYSFLDLKNGGYVQGEFDQSKPIETWGPNSPIPECRKLEK